MSSKLLSASELLQAETGIDWNTLAENASGPADPLQLIEQSQLIDDASMWVGNYTDMPVGVHATTQTEMARIARAGFYGAKCFVDQDGWLNVRCDSLPILSVNTLQFSYTPLSNPIVWNNVTPLVSVVLGEYPQLWQISDSSRDWTGARYSGTFIQVNYTSGWPNAVTTGSITSGSNIVIPVDDATGFAVSNAMNPVMNPYQNFPRIYDGVNTENVSVTAVSVTANHTADTITVASLAKNHAAGVRISTMPADLRRAVILACVHIARQRGAQAIAMGGARGEIAMGKDTEALSEAEYLLEPYRRVIG